MGISQDTLQFLLDIEQNNNREWFAENKQRYKDSQQEVKTFLEEVVQELAKHDEIESIKQFRIYRDIRFSHDKTPYKTNLTAGIKRAGATRRGGMYFHLQPGDRTYIGGGFWGPEKHDLKRIRQEIDRNAQPLREILSHPDFKDSFGEMSGEQVKTAPKGYKKDHPAIDLLRYKSFTMGKNFLDQEVTSDQFKDNVVATFRKMYPFFDYFSLVLTTNLNGESII